MTPLPHLCYPQWHGDISILPALSPVFLENILGELWLVLTLSLHLQLESSGCDNTSRTHSVSIKIQDDIKQTKWKKEFPYFVFLPHCPIFYWIKNELSSISHLILTRGFYLFYIISFWINIEMKTFIFFLTKSFSLYFLMSAGSEVTPMFSP